MPNILATPSRWTDGASTSPPAVWTGTDYDFIGDSGASNQITAMANAGDIVAFTINNLSASPVPTPPNGFQVLVNGSQVYAYDLRNVGTDTFTSSSLSNGDVVKIWANTQFVLSYAVDFTLTAITPTLVAADESITVAQGSSNNAVPTEVTESGSPVNAVLAVATQPTHGSAILASNVITYTPVNGYSGLDSFTYNGAFDGTTSNDATISVTVTPTPTCQELGRVTRSFVSGYEASRVETRRIRRFSKRCCVANFNGAMGENVTITKIRWDCTSPWSVHMSNPRVETGGRTAAVDCSFNYAGYAGLKATATWSNGEITGVEFFFAVLDRPLYPMAEYANSNGPYVVEASA